jgi:hypothetical protein
MPKYRLFVIFKTSETVNDVELIRHVVDEIEDECLVYARSCIVERQSDIHWRFDVKSKNSVIVHHLVDLLLSKDEVQTYYMSRIKD